MDSGKSMVRVCVLGLSIWWVSLTRTSFGETALRDSFVTFMRWVEED